MPVLFNQDDVQQDQIAAGVTSQVLLNEALIGNDRIMLQRLVIEPGAQMPLSTAPGGFAWAQLLSGTARLTADGIEDHLTKSHIVLLPPDFEGTLAGVEPCELLLANVPDAARFDPEFTTNPPPYRCVDWTREPVLDAEHDARKRIYMVTPKMFATKAFKGEMIIYPPNTFAPTHHHEGAEHFQYVIAGTGTVFLSEKPQEMRQGDVLYNYEFERHYFENHGDEDFIFVEFFVPGECKTIWVPGADVCAWVPTGQDIEGRMPVREIKAHSSELVTTPDDV